jgi:predicted nucleic acid-binding protein
MQVVVDTNVLISGVIKPNSRIASLYSFLKQRDLLLLYSSDIKASRDLADNIFLELAVDGKADYIVSGDKDLLILKSFQGIPILTPAELLDLLEKH